jgi:cardiolipin synthase A/B
LPDTPQYIPGNRVTLLISGKDYFPALIAAIDNARRDVSFETYIYAEDQTGEAVTDALVRAARRGVSVRLLIDGFGTRVFPARWRKQLEEAGGSLLFFRPLSRWRITRSELRRMHRKIAVVDGAVAFVGGLNIIGDLTEVKTAHPRFDLAVKVEGPLVARIYAAVEGLWRGLTAFQLARGIPRSKFECRTDPVGDLDAALVLRDNLKHRRDIEHVFIHGIQTARHDIVIACAYFLPGRRFRRLLRDATARGVRVVLLLQGSTDHVLLQWATRALYENLLDHGVEIHEYEKSEMHAKAAVFDGRTAMVGSSNLDPFSLLLSREANVVVRDEAFGAGLQAVIEDTIKDGAQPVRRMLWKHRPFWSRVGTWIGYGFARFAIGVAGLRGF